jgi:capsular exopolysaccharide synthesis family protein
MTNRKKAKIEENHIVELFRTIRPYGWSIFFITVIVSLLTALNLYFKPSIYESYAIIKIKSEARGAERLRAIDPLSSALAISGNSEVDQELAILKTFYINNKAIDKLDLKVQYFEKIRYKKVEIFLNPPIKVKDITIFDKKILGKKIELIPIEYGFRLKIGENISSKIYKYGQVIKSKRFKLIIDKESNFNNSIYFKLNGSNRNIYEKIVRKNLKVSRLKDNISLIKVAYQDTSASRATRYVDTLIDVYIAQSIIDKSKKNNKILNFIEEQLGTTGKRLKLSENQLEEYRVSNSVIEPSIQSETIINRLSDIEVELSENSIRERLIKNLITFVKHNRNLDSITPTLRELGDEPTIRVIERLQDLQRRATELSRDFTEKHPDLKAIRRDISRNRKTVLLNIENLKTNIASRKKDLISLKKKHEKNLKTLPTKEQQLVELRRDYEVNSKMYSYLLEKKSENEMKRVATVSDYEVIDSAYSNGIPIKPKRTSTLLIFTLFGFVSAVLLSILRNYMVNRVQNSKDIKKLTTLPIYGETAILVDFSNKREILKNPTSPIVKSFRNLRTNIQFNSKKPKGNVILITSSVSKEGKTTVASNLSTIFQMANYKSIIVDLDLYKPTLHKKFNINYQGGISNYLRGKESLGEIIFSTAYPNLDIIPAGPISADAPELILSKKFNSMLETLKERYEYIFIDSAPFSVVADTLYLMQYTDINLIVVRKNFTEKSFITELEDTIEEHGFKNVALFINEE